LALVPQLRRFAFSVIATKVLVLAVPSMTQAGPCNLYRWRSAFGAELNGPDKDVSLEETEPPAVDP